MSAPTVTTIRPGVTFTPAAAASWQRMEHAVGRQIDCNSSYRDWNTQYAMWQAWTAWVNGTGPKPPHGRAIHPDQSMHCKGLAADTDDIDLLLSLSDHGWRRTASDESWHFEYQQHNDQHVGEPAGGNPTPIPEEEAEENPMYIANVMGSFYLVIGTKAHVLAKGSHARESGIPVIDYPDEWAKQQLKTVVTGIA